MLFTKILKSGLVALVLLLAMAVSVYGYLSFENNKTVRTPKITSYQTSLDNAVNWLEANREALLKENNPILWWFLSESARITENSQIKHLVDDYLTQTLDSNSIWNLYFEPHAFAPFSVESFFNLPAYNLHFIYGLTCDKEMGQLDIVKRRLKPDFCRWHPIISPCTTHQLVGMYLMQLRQCGDAQKIDAVIADLQDQIERQLVFDPRVGDVYIQRVLMLVATGAKERVKPIWLQNILNAQLGDGSWQSFHPLFPVGDSRYLGFGYRFVSIKAPKSSFHTTAQAIWLLSLMANEALPR